MFFYRLNLTNGIELINLTLVRNIKLEGNKLTFWYRTHPQTFGRSAFQETQYYTYNTPQHAEETLKAIEKALATAPKLE
jgi:hypothetical protein